MTKLDTLKQHQAWRRGSDDHPMQDPTEIGLAIDYAIAVCEAAERMVDSGLGTARKEYVKLENAVKAG